MPRNRSAVGSPVHLVWSLCNEMDGASRAEVIAAAVARGVNVHTARTQYQRWRDEQKSVAAWHASGVNVKPKMPGKSVDWTPETLASWCGPAAVASALGIERVEAARRILEARFNRAGSRELRPRKRGLSNIYELAEVLARPVISLVALARLQLTPCGGLRVRADVRSCPTLEQWLAMQAPGREAVIRCSHHFLHTRGPMVVEDNGHRPRQGRVTHVIYLDPR